MSKQDDDLPVKAVPAWRPLVPMLGILGVAVAASLELGDAPWQKGLLAFGTTAVLGGGFLWAYRQDVLTYRSRDGAEARRRLDRSLGHPTESGRVARKAFWVAVVSTYFGDFQVARAELTRLASMPPTAAAEARLSYGEGLLALFERRDYGAARQLLAHAHSRAEQAVKDSTDSEGPDTAEVAFARACGAAREAASLLGHPADQSAVAELETVRGLLLPGLRLPVLFALATWHRWEDQKERAGAYLELIRRIGPHLRAVLDLPPPPPAGPAANARL